MIATLEDRLATEDLQEQLVVALRVELEEYGGLLALFNAQQEAILDRAADRVLELGGEIEQQAQKTKIRRRQREAFVEAVAAGAGRPEVRSLRDLTPFFRAPMRPMIDALTDEVNRLIGHTRRRAKQNQMLLVRAMEVTGELLAQLSPETMTKTYSARGQMKMSGAARPPRLLDRS